jgi:flagellin-like protein
MKKGISPIVAAIILIGVTIVIGIMISTWVSQWLFTNIENVPSTCPTSTLYELSSVKYNKTTQILTLKLTNKATQTLYNFTIEATDSSSSIYRNTSVATNPSVTSTSPLTQEQSVFLTANMTTTNSLSSVKVINGACIGFSRTTETISNVV